MNTRRDAPFVFPILDERQANGAPTEGRPYKLGCITKYKAGEDSPKMDAVPSLRDGLQALEPAT
jgi:hypothetical protein